MADFDRYHKWVPEPDLTTILLGYAHKGVALLAVAFILAYAFKRAK